VAATDTNRVLGVAVSGNYAYAVTSFNFGVIDISSPVDAHVISTIDAGGETVAVSGNYAFAASYYSNGLNIVDISTPASAQLVKLVALPGIAKDVAAAGRYAYVACNGGGLRIIQLW
jgi:hypothetical protein